LITEKSALTNVFLYFGFFKTLYQTNFVIIMIIIMMMIILLLIIYLLTLIILTKSDEIYL